MNHHVSTRIDTLLSMHDEQLQSLFGSFGPDIRKELEDKKEIGHLLIGSESCDGFCPINGCPGHEQTVG